MGRQAAGLSRVSAAAIPLPLSAQDVTSITGGGTGPWPAARPGPGEARVPSLGARTNSPQHHSVHVVILLTAYKLLSGKPGAVPRDQPEHPVGALGRAPLQDGVVSLRALLGRLPAHVDAVQTAVADAGAVGAEGDPVRLRFEVHQGPGQVH